MKKYFSSKFLKNQKFQKLCRKIFFHRKFRSSEKLFFSRKKYLKNFRFQILKINFRHEKLIFFAQDFFPGKVWSCTFDFWPLRRYSSTLAQAARGNVKKSMILHSMSVFSQRASYELVCVTWEWDISWNTNSKLRTMFLKDEKFRTLNFRGWIKWGKIRENRVVELSGQLN